MKYTWNFDRDEEYWNNDEYNTVEECIEDARNGMIPGEGYVVYIGEVVPYEPKIDADAVLKRLEEEAYDEVGDAADGWEIYMADKDNELGDALTEVLKNWLKKHNLEPCFYSIRNIREYSLITGKEK